MPKRASLDSKVPLHSRIAKAMGTETMNVTEVLQALEDEGEPKSRANVNKVLLRAETLVDGIPVKRFTHVARGHYRVALEPDNATDQAPNQRKVASNGHTTQQASNGRIAKQPSDMADLRRLIRMYGTLAVRSLLEEIERE